MPKPVTYFTPRAYTQDGEPCYIVPKRIFQEGLLYIREVDNKSNMVGTYEVTKEDLQNYFYTLQATNIEFVQNIGIDVDMFDTPFSLKEYSTTGIAGLSNTEASFLYNFVKKIQPKRILEFSCGSGTSTMTISRALIDSNKVPTYFETHEIDELRVKETQQTLVDNNVNFVKIKLGDVFDTLDRNKLQEVDFLFVDSNHEEDFTRQYIREFFPLLKKGCWVAIHDMRLHPNYKTGESKAIIEYLINSNSVSFFHIADLLKHFKIMCLNDEFEHCCRNTLLFFQKE